MSNFGPANSNTVNLVPIQGVLDTNGNVTAVVSPNGTLLPMSPNNAALSRNVAGQIVGIVGDAGAVFPLAANPAALSQDASGNATGIYSPNGAIVPIGVNAALSYSRGDSITVGYGLASPSFAYGAVFSLKYGLTHTNYGYNSTGVLTQYIKISGNIGRQAQGVNALTVWLCGYNDMRSGNSAGRLSAFRGALAAGSLLAVSKLSAFRNYYNGGPGGVGLGAPAGSLSYTFSAGLSNYGNSADWRGLPSITNGQTVTATVSGSVVYVIYDRFKTNTGGTFSVTIDGSVVIPSVICDGTNLGVESANDQPTGDNPSNGYPTLLRVPTTPGKHTVIVTVTSASASTNKVQIEAIAGNDDAIGGNTLIIANTLRMNAAGYAGSPAAYGSQTIGDAAVRQYQQIVVDVVSMLQQDGFKVFCADTSNYDPTISANVQADNIHPNATGAALVSAAIEQAYLGAHQVVAASGGGDIQTPVVAASPAIYQNISKTRQQVFITGGTVSLVELSRDGLVFVTLGTGSPFNIILSPNDYLRVTYSAVPSATVVPV